MSYLISSTFRFFKQRDLKDQLKRGLAALPAPKNDYEIVVPENEAMELEEVSDQKDNYVEDQADIDARAVQDQIALSKYLTFYDFLHFDFNF